MIGDKVKPTPEQRRAAGLIFDVLATRVTGRNVITVAGESGAGKSEIALVLSQHFEAQGTPAFIFQQDDYFVYPPRTNADKRRQDIGHVGLGEVRLDLLDEHVDHFKTRPEQTLDKPLVIFDDDRISNETIDPSAYQIGVAEGTYTTTLENADFRVFIDRNFEETLQHRRARARDTIDEFSERILQIEHDIISKHKSMADIVVNTDYSITVMNPNLKTD